MKETVETQTGRQKPIRAFRVVSIAVLVALLVQFLLGMIVNLSVEIPQTHPGADSTEYFAGVLAGIVWAIARGVLFLRLHVILGVLLFTGSLAAGALALAGRRASFIAASAAGWALVTAAAFNGASFVNYGHEVSSFLMAAFFLFALISYGWLACAAGRGGVGREDFSRTNDLGHA